MAKEKNENIELITGDPKKAIVKLSYPLMLTMILIMMYNLVDSIWVAGLGTEALAAIGFVTPLYMAVIGMGNGVAAGANSLIARKIGAEDYDQANNAALHSILLSVVISAILTAIILIFMVPILEAIGAGDTMQYSLDYSYVIFGFMFVIVFEELASAIFRAEGDIRRATIVIAASVVVNIVLDPILIYHFNMGISGAAWATIISTVFSCIILAYLIWGKKDLYLDLSLKKFNFQIDLIWENLKVAIPSTVETLITSALIMIINVMLEMVGGYPSVGVYTAAMRIVQLGTLPILAIGVSLITVAGVAYGAKNAENLKTAHSYSIKICLVISSLIVVFIIAFASQIAPLFASGEVSSTLIPQIATALQILSFFIILLPFGAMSAMMFQGIGKGTTSMIITFLRYFTFNILFAYIFCFEFGWGENGIYLGFVVGSFVGGLIGYIWTKSFIKSFENSLKIRAKAYEKLLITYENFKKKW